MGNNVTFDFKNKTYSCTIYLDNAEDPCFVFVEFTDVDLIRYFGKEITIRTDFEKMLPRKDDYPELSKLRSTLFEQIKITKEFIAVKNKILLRGAPSENIE